MRTSFFSLLLIALVARAALAAEEAQPRTVSTTGDAVVYVTPDEVIVSFGVETFHRQLDYAKASNDEASNRLLKAIKDMKIEEKHVQTAQLEVEIRYQNNSHPAAGIEGYNARRAYSVTLKDVKLFEKLVDVGLKNGANRLMGFEFRTTELRKHRDEARKMAIKAAQEKAAALAGELKCKIGAPRTIGEGGGYWGGRWNWQGNVSGQNAAQAVGGAEPGGETLPLGQIGVNAQVSVTFDLVPGQ
jgi:uncharacterized protein YggE